MKQTADATLSSRLTAAAAILRREAEDMRFRLGFTGWSHDRTNADASRAAYDAMSSGAAILKEAAKMLEACAPYLKDGETPAQRIERERKDGAAVLGLLAKEKRRVAELEADKNGLSEAWECIDMLQAELSSGCLHVAELEAEVERLRKDAEYLDWLELQYVEVRIPLRYGSKECFCSSPDDDDGELLPWDIRAAIDKARAAKGGE